MSAGDVQFVGWTGGDPLYKELPASYQVEPADNPEYVRKRLQISRICFQKDEQAVIQGMPLGDTEITSSYIDTDGSAKTKSFGSGYTFLNVSIAPQGVGFTRITAVYEKTVHKIFEIGLPDGLSITCENGKGLIKYKTHILEEIDTGDGVCRAGLVPDIYPIVQSEFFNPVKQIDYEKGTIDPPLVNYLPFYGFDIKLNEKIVDRVIMDGLNVPVRQYISGPSIKRFHSIQKFQKEYRYSEEEIIPPYADIISERREWIDSVKISQSEIENIQEIYRDKFAFDPYTAIKINVYEEVNEEDYVNTQPVLEPSYEPFYQVVATPIGSSKTFAYPPEATLPKVHYFPINGKVEGEVWKNAPNQILETITDPSTFVSGYVTGEYSYNLYKAVTQYGVDYANIGEAINYKTELVEIPNTVYRDFGRTRWSSTRSMASVTVWVEITPTFNVPSITYQPKLRWQKTGNTIKLMFGDLAVREYDVTGLT